MKDQHAATNPLSDAEDQLVRRLADGGYSPREMVVKMQVSGFRRGRVTLRMHMDRNNITVNPAAYLARTGKPYRDALADKSCDTGDAEMTGNGRRPIHPNGDEARIISEGGRAGHSAGSIVFALRQAGFDRSRETVRNWMILNNIARPMDILRENKRQAVVIARQRQKEMKEDADALAAQGESEELWDDRWNKFHGRQQYQDHPRAEPCRATKITAESDTSYRTMGGVAVYG